MILILIGLRHLEYYFMYYVYGLKQLNPCDQALLFDNDLNRTNVLVCFISEKFKSDELINKVKNKAYEHPRTRSKIT